MKLVRTILITLLLLFLLKWGVVSSYYIPYAGMENALYEGDRVLVKKYAYGIQVPFVNTLGHQQLLERPAEYGDIVVFKNPNPQYHKSNIIERASYIGRCVGVPGDTLVLDREQRFSTVLHRDLALAHPYFYPASLDDSLQQVMKAAHIQANKLVGYKEDQYIRCFSNQEIAKIQPQFSSILQPAPLPKDTSAIYTSLIIPQKGEVITMTPQNVSFYAKVILQHEQEAALVKDSVLYINGIQRTSYTFKQNYYWMLSNNAINLHDSRHFGFVPQNHLIGKAFLIWLSKDTTSSLWEGYRWNRFFQIVQ
ncbi:MAG: signal peptidase I [Bacteroidaceae bacterium]